MFYIYSIENKINGKIYIGKTNAPEDRWRTHKTIAKGGPELYKDRYFYLHKSMAKHGANNFVFNIIELYDTEYESFRAEEYWISYLRDFGIKLYNLSEGGEGPTGFKHSEESKKMMSLHHTYKSGLEHFRYGITHTDEAKQKISKANKGRFTGEKNRFFGKKGELSMCFGRTGDKHPNTKISEANLIILRKEIASGKFFQKELAEKYGVSIALISGIKNNKARTK